MNELHDLLTNLIQFESITPHDAGCQKYIMKWLTNLGFECQTIDYDPVSNFFARIGHNGPLLVFAGHTDVVHPGNKESWHSDPFKLTQNGDKLIGRGVADMKGSLACMMLAAKAFLTNHPSFSGSLGFLITSGEEGDEYELGTPKVMEHLNQTNIHIDYCVLGEPSSTKSVGDVIKVGRRGSLTGRLTHHGKQGHVAYPHLAKNPIHTISSALNELVNTKWDEGNDYFPPTTFQVTHLESGGLGGNVIPGDLYLQFNFRYSTEFTAKELTSRVQSCLKSHGVAEKVKWQYNGQPFLTEKSMFIDKSIEAIHNVTGIKAELSTSGGTSDGRFIAPHGVPLIELGPVNKTIHQINECVSTQELIQLKNIYYQLCEQLIL